MDVSRAEPVPDEAEKPDPGLVDPADAHSVEMQQAVVWLRQRWQFASVLASLRELTTSLHLQRVSADQLELALVKAKSQSSLIAELLCKLSWQSESGKYLGKDFQDWDKVLKERVQAMYGDDAAQSHLTDQHWLSMGLQAKVCFPSCKNIFHSAKCAIARSEAPLRGLKATVSASSSLQLKVLNDLCNWKMQEQSGSKHPEVKLLLLTPYFSLSTSIPKQSILCMHNSVYVPCLVKFKAS